MENILSIILGIHVLSGIISLLAGSIGMISVKGAKLHRRSGIIFYYSMLSVAVTAVILSIFRKSDFLLMIGIFTFYQVYSGKRAIENKSLIPAKADWLVLVLSIVNTVFMLVSLKPVLMVFGFISLGLCISELRINILHLRKQLPAKNEWLARHIGCMIGGYISAFTAFLVVNAGPDGSWLVWLGPSIVFVPLIIYWTRKYSPKTKQSNNHEITPLPNNSSL